MFKNVRVLARFRQNSKLILDLKNRDLVFNSRLLLSALQPLFGLVIQCPSYPTEERARSVRDQTKVAQEITLTAIPPLEKER